MRTRSFSTGLLSLAVLLASACAPQFSGTNAVPKPAPQALYVNEDFTLWHTEGTMAPVIHMEMAPSVSAQKNGKAQVSFDAAGTLTLAREIPTPGDALVKVTGTAQLENAAVIYQLWQDGKLLAERGNGGAIDVGSNVESAGMIKHVLVIRAAGKAKVTLEDVHISVTKRG